MMAPKKLIRKFAPKRAVKIIESGFRKSRGLSLQARYGFPARGMRVIAVTGTNGKSTTSSYINEVLKAAGYKTAVLTTVFYEIDGKVQPNKTHQTIDRQSIVQDFFSRAKNADADFVILEVTSHALDQDRIMGVPVEIAVITNLTQDHLDYHGTMEEYAKVKARLLRNFGAKYAILNADDAWYDFFRENSVAEVVSIGKAKGLSGQIKSIKLHKDSSEAKLEINGESIEIKTSLVGEFNLYNASYAAAIGQILKLQPKTIEKGISNLKSLNGRMESIEAGQKFKVFVDFAVTPDAIEKVLQSLQKTTKGSVRIVFGATGDRDKAKRPTMGQVAAKNADFIYLTDDETYTENPEAIRKAVYVGIEKANGAKKTKVIGDRKEAIQQALKDAKAGDAVLITGMGHEDYRNMDGKKIPWNEQEIVAQLLKNT